MKSLKYVSLPVMNQPDMSLILSWTDDTHLVSRTLIVPVANESMYKQSVFNSCNIVDQFYTLKMIFMVNDLESYHKKNWPIVERVGSQ